MKGIDVSEHQPPPLALAGVDFLIARVTMGAAGVDRYGWAHLLQGHGAGLVLVAYHFLRGDSAGVAQAKRFLDRVAAIEQGIGEVGLMVDVENLDKPNPPWHLPTYRQVLLDFLEHVRSSSLRRCLVYGPGAYLPALALPAEIATLHPLMLADWTPPYPIPAPWTKLAIHQHSTSGGKLDLNRFDGTRDELLLELGLATPSPVHAELGALADRIRLASGRGEGPEDFVSTDDGPPSR